LGLSRLGDPLKTLAAALLLCAVTAAALPDSFDGIGEKPGAGTLEAFATIRREHPGTSSTGLLQEGPAAQAMATPDTYYNATASCSGEGNRTYGVCLDMKASGLGHDHSNATPPIEFPNNDRCKSGIPMNSSVAWKFKTPAHAATLTLTWTWSGACSGSQTKTAQAGIEGLSPLPAGIGYALVGATAKHASNHYATGAVLSAIPLIASDYRATFPKDSDLLVNDISLLYGGLFDIGGGWAAPHITHRFGSQVDLQKSTIPAEHQAKFEELAKKHGARILIEGTHYHLDFTPASSPFYEEVLRCDL